ncbi:hypothetical protein GE061_016457 [Apolygus lucorum]|uniref:Regulatory protein zeste n=1 Tax=Apolygus lucorum TaxID=248454 RepID=A0A6A4KKK1_APOLU|nr:hypothetical protein GE061_016457 [Apolygus lucorum]
MFSSEKRRHSPGSPAETNKPPDRPAKRTRLQNFSRRENELLIHLAQQEVQIIENKATNAETSKLKTDVWHAITEAFNSHHIGEPRDMVSLRHRYENLKRGLRKKILEQKELLAEGEMVQLMTTNYEAKLWEMMVSKPDGVEILNESVIEVSGDGGSSRIEFIPTEDLDKDHVETLAIGQDHFVSSVTIKGETSRDSFREEGNSDEEEGDATSTTKETTTAKTSNKDYVVMDPVEVSRYLRSAGKLLPENFSRPYRLKPKPKPSVAFVNNESISNSFHTDESIDANRFREEEHQLKMKNMKEEHEAKMKILTQELKMKEEEHAMRMKILKRKLIVICEDI